MHKVVKEDEMVATVKAEETRAIALGNTATTGIWALFIL